MPKLKKEKNITGGEGGQKATPCLAQHSWLLFSISDFFLMIVRKYHVYHCLLWLARAWDPVPGFQGTENHTPAQVLQALVMPELHERSGSMNVSTLCRHCREYDLLLLELVFIHSDSVLVWCSHSFWKDPHSTGDGPWKSFTQ